MQPPDPQLRAHFLQVCEAASACFNNLACLEKLLQICGGGILQMLVRQHHRRLHPSCMWCQQQHVHSAAKAAATPALMHYPHGSQPLPYRNHYIEIVARTSSHHTPFRLARGAASLS